MNQLEFHKNELQMDYFSESYRKFEHDFYRYSALDTPLTFLTDDILLAMANSKKITSNSIKRTPKIDENIILYSRLKI